MATNVISHLQEHFVQPNVENYEKISEVVEVRMQIISDKITDDVRKKYRTSLLTTPTQKKKITLLAKEMMSPISE